MKISHKMFMLAGLAVTVGIGLAAGKKVRVLTQNELDAIRWKESSGLPDNEVVDGDGGKASGPFQVWEDYWKDAADYDKTLVDEPGENYQKCRERAYAERVVRAYVARYSLSSDWSFWNVARLHNAGPSARKNKKISSAYADIVVRNLKSLEKGESPKNK